jgi:uncharacterized protein
VKRVTFDEDYYTHIARGENWRRLAGPIAAISRAPCCISWKSRVDAKAGGARMNNVAAIGMSSLGLVALGALSGTVAGLLAGLVGIGGGVVVVPVVYYGLCAAGTAADHAAHIAIGTSLAAILPAAVVSSIGHWRAGNTDVGFMREWGPGIVIGVVAAQLAAPHLRGSLMTGIFSLVCLIFAARFALPERFTPIAERPPTGTLRSLAGASIGIVSGLAGVGGGIMTNIVMTLSGVPMHKSIGRAASVGVVVALPATVVAALASGTASGDELGSINLAVWASIAPAQAAAAWVGVRLAQRLAAPDLSRVMAIVLLMTGFTMFRASL